MAIRGYSKNSDNSKANETKKLDKKILPVDLTKATNVYLTTSVTDTISGKNGTSTSGMRVISSLGRTDLYPKLKAIEEIRDYINGGLIHLYWDNYFGSPLIISKNRELIMQLSKSPKAFEIIMTFLEGEFAKTEYGTSTEYFLQARRLLGKEFDTPNRVVPPVEFKEEKVIVKVKEEKVIVKEEKKEETPSSPFLNFTPVVRARKTEETPIKETVKEECSECIRLAKENDALKKQLEEATKLIALLSDDEDDENIWAER